MDESTINNNLSDLLDLFNDFRETFNKEKQQLLNVSNSMCDNLNESNKKLYEFDKILTKHVNECNANINDIRLSIMKINQFIDNTNVSTNKNFESLNNIINEQNNKIAILEKQLKNVNTKHTNKSSRLSFIHPVINFICFPYKYIVNLIKERQRKEQEELEKQRKKEEELRILEQQKIEEEKRKAKEAEEKRKQEEFAKQQINQILSNSKRHKKGNS